MPNYDVLLIDSLNLSLKVIPESGDNHLVYLSITQSPLTVTSQGDGSGVGHLTLTVSSSIILTLDGVAIFTSNPNGTGAMSQSATLNVGQNTLYIKCTGGTSNITFSDITAVTKFGNYISAGAGFTPGWAYSGVVDITNIPLLDLSNWNFPNCTNIGFSYGSSLNIFNGNINVFSTALEKMYMGAGGTMTGSLSSVASTCTELFLPITTTFSDNVNVLQSGLLEFQCTGGNALTGNVSGFPSTLTYIYVAGSNTISGDINGIPSGLKYFYVFGSNTISGDIGGIPSSVEYFQVYGSNTLSGSLSGITTKSLKGCLISGYNTINGSTADIPTSMTQVLISGYNTISGNTSTITSGITQFDIYGQNTFTGDIANIPIGVEQFNVVGYNTVYGNLQDFSSAMRRVEVFGYNVISGDTANIPIGITTFQIYGYNTITGDINNIPTNSLNTLDISGYNTCYGTLSSTVYAMTRYINFKITGLNVITGDVQYLPQNATVLSMGGNNTISDYTSGRTWPNGIWSISIRPGSGGLSSTEVDNLLIDLNNSSWNSGMGGNQQVDLRGSNASRTAASNSAVSGLQGKGVTVYTN